MPMFDRKCPRCALVHLDRLEPMDPPVFVPCEGCGAPTERVWLAKASSVIGDECDIWAQNGLCNPDGSPRRYTSKSEMAREAAKRGLVSHVEHIGSKESDKSRHTSRWI